MNKNILFILSLLSILVSLSSCGGGGGGGISAAPGTNTGVPSVVKLLDVQNIAQTNSTLYLKAKVLDGSGKPVPNVPVNFTNLSAPFGQLSATIANTDATGVATVTLQSAEPGFSTVLAEINAGAGQVRDRRSVFFTNFIFGLPEPPPPFMSLDVNSVPGNSTFNEPSDFMLFENTSDDTVEIIATVFNADGSRVGAGLAISWTSDHPEEVEFTRTDPITDGNGQAQAIVKVKANSLRATETHVNIGVASNDGAVSMVTLYLKPVTVNSVVVTANPSIVDSGGKSVITAFATTTAGSAVPDGTSVSFNTTGGGGTAPSFAQTVDGIVTADLTAPNVTVNTTLTVTASASGKSGSATVTVRAPVIPPPEPTPLAIVPTTVSVNGNSGGTTTFKITGGTPPYTTTSSNLTIACNSTDADCIGATGTWSGASVLVTVPASTPAASVTINTFDSVGATVSATLNIVIP
jgi:hypothetical protein